MTIIFYDGSILHCDCVEIAHLNPHKLIVDGFKVIPSVEVQRIVAGLLSGYREGVASNYANQR